jgi:hypothetical protein
MDAAEENLTRSLVRSDSAGDLKGAYLLMAKAFGREVRFMRIKTFERSSRPMVESRLVDLTREHNCLHVAVDEFAKKLVENKNGVYVPKDDPPFY